MEKEIERMKIGDMARSLRRQLREYPIAEHYHFSMDRGSIQVMIRIAENYGKLGNFEMAYNDGYEHGYQDAIKDMAKRVKEMKKYGGSKQNQRAEGVPGVRTGSVEADK